MGIILPQFKKALIDELKYSISANTSQYYAFAANPISLNPVANNTLDDYSALFENDWKMIFGKKLSNTNVVPVIKNIPWQTNTVYTKYDNTKDLSNSQFYVVAEPDEVGGYYNIFKCINNSNNSVSTIKPNLINPDSFTNADGYTWRYIYSISSANYNKFSTTEFVPFYANTNQQDIAYTFSGVEVVMISNGGIGYNSYHDGIIRSVSNSTLVQIENNASNDNDFYTKSAIYIFNESSTTSQLRNITSYTANTSGKWVKLDTPANTTNIYPSITGYKIRPRVLFNTDADEQPLAYCSINTTSNSILSINILNIGYGVSRASASIVSNGGYGANLYCIVPPPGGHSFNPENELNVNGLAIYFDFNSTESNTITINTLYNKIGIIRDPYSLDANNVKGSVYSNTTFSQILKANVATPVTFAVGDTVKGNTSGALGVVLYSNTTVLHLVGDKQFSTGEYITSSNGLVSTIMTINTLGDIYTKDIVPLYVRNVSDVSRANGQTEAFKLIIQV
jgi:hypothetical protein